MAKIAKIFLIVFLLFIEKSQAQHISGLPEIINFYNPSNSICNEQVWQIKQANNGLLYFAANRYLLEYDGLRWKALKDFGTNKLLSLAIDSAGNFYFGQRTSIGYGKIKNNVFVYNNFGVNVQVVNVFKTFYLSDYVYFLSNKTDVLVYHNKNLELLQRPSNFEIKRGFVVGKKLFLVSDNGIALVKGYDLDIISYKAHYVYSGDIRSILPYGKNKYLVATLHKGLFIFDLKKDSFEKFNSDLDNQDISFYNGTVYNDSIYILTTLSKGCYIINKQGRVIFHFDQKNGLEADAVYCAYIDKLNNLWLGTSKGVSYIKLNSYFYRFDSRQGINERIYSSDIFGSYLIIGTSKNLLYMDLSQPQNFISSSNILQYGTPHCHIKLGHDNFLVYSGYYKMNVYDSKMKVVSSQNTEQINDLYTNPLDSSEFYVASTEGLSLQSIQKIGNKYLIKKIRQFEGVDYPINKIFIDKFSDFWLINSNNIFCLDFNDKGEYKLRLITKLKDDLPLYQVFASGDYVFFNSDTNVFYIKNSADKLKIKNLRNAKELPYFSDLKNKIIDAVLKKSDSFVFVTDSGLVETNDSLRVIKKYYFLSNYEKKETNLSFYKSNLFFNNRSYVFSFNNGTGLFVKTIRRKIKLRSYSMDLDNVKYVYNSDSLLFVDDSVVRLKRPVAMRAKLDFSFYSLPIELPKAKYYYRIAEDNGKWIPLESNSLLLSHLKSGKYMISVMAKDQGGNKYETLTINFRIKKPIYLSFFAILFYFLVISLLFIFLLKLATKKVKERKDILEILVKERTEELEEQKEEIETQARLLKSQKSILEKETIRLKLAMIELEQLSTVAQKTDNAVLIIDKNRKFEWWNRGFVDLFKYKIEKYKDLPLRLAHQKIREDVYKEIKSYSPDKGIISYTNHEVFENGEEIWYQTTINPLLDENGKLLKFIIIDKNISELKNYEINIQNLNEINALLREKINKLESDLSIYMELTANLKNSEIQNIEYALLLRDILVYNKQKISKCFGTNYMLVDVPKDVLSGDFLWCDANKDELFIAIGDCSGHKIHGTILSVILLEQLKKIYFSNEKNLGLDILMFKLNNRMFEIKQNYEILKEYDTFSISLIKIDFGIKELYFSGSKLSLTYLKNNNIEKLEADNFFIGEQQNKYFDIYNLALEKGMKIYIYSDGWPNMLGNLGIKKYTYKRIKELLLKIENIAIEEQKEIILASISEWKGNFEQMDDILILGLEI